MRVKLNNFLRQVKRNTEVIKDGVYPQIGVRVWGKGSYVRDTITGKDTQYKTLFQVRAGDLIINKIWTRNGAIAIVPDDQDGCFVSTEFPTFEIDTTQVDPNWLSLRLATEDFWHQCALASGGTSGKNRIKVEKFLDIEIELPEIQKQQLVVQKLKLVSEKEFSIRTKIDGNKKILAQISSRLFSHKTFDAKTENLGDYLLDISYGLSVSAKPVEHSDDVRLLRITDIQNNTVKWDSVPTFSTQNSVKDSQLLGDGDIVIARTGGTIGKSFLVSEMSHKAVYASYLIRMRTKKNELNPRFLSFFLNSDLYWKQLHAKKRGTGQPNVNSQVLKSIKIPVPTIEQQTKLIEDLDLFSKKNNLLLSLLNKQSNILSQLLIKSSKKEGV